MRAGRELAYSFSKTVRRTMNDKRYVSRRTSLKGFGALGATTLFGDGAPAPALPATPPFGANDVLRAIRAKVWNTPFIDTHEHLIEERVRLADPARRWVKCDDWSLLLSGYLASDLLAAGMPPTIHEQFYSDAADARRKWQLLEPYWPFVQHTGYAQAAQLSLRALYGVDKLAAGNVGQVQAGYEKLRAPGFYNRVLRDVSRIDSCQVNCLGRPFQESELPTLLMQDLSIVGMFAGPGLEQFGKPTGINVASLSDWHAVIDWWFARYGTYAVAVKSQNAYSRDIDYEPTPAEQVEATFHQRLADKPVTPEECKRLEDHLFWYAVNKATEYDLPVKLHTGYYAGQNSMPLSRLINNAGSACELCRAAPATTFVFMHICYPYYEELLAVAKHYTNAYVDMCWSWIINPLAAKDFLKKYLVTAPANKIVTFGGDYLFVEQVVGHAEIARCGIALALTELVAEGWLTLDDALALTDPIMHGNARHIFHLAAKENVLKNVSWSASKGL